MIRLKIRDLVEELETKEKELRQSGINEDNKLLEEIGKYVGNDIMKLNIPIWDKIAYVPAFYTYVIENFKDKVDYANKMRDINSTPILNKYDKQNVRIYFNNITSDPDLLRFLISFNDKNIMEGLMRGLEDEKDENKANALFKVIEKMYQESVPKDKYDSTFLLTNAGKSLVNELNNNVIDAYSNLPDQVFLDSQVKDSNNKVSYHNDEVVNHYDSSHDRSRYNSISLDNINFKKVEFNAGQKIASAQNHVLDVIKSNMSDDLLNSNLNESTNDVSNFYGDESDEVEKQL